MGSLLNFFFFNIQGIVFPSPDLHHCHWRSLLRSGYLPSPRTELKLLGRRPLCVHTPVQEPLFYRLNWFSPWFINDQLELRKFLFFLNSYTIRCPLTLKVKFLKLIMTPLSFSIILGWYFMAFNWHQVEKKKNNTDSI